MSQLAQHNFQTTRCKPEGIVFRDVVVELPTTEREPESDEDRDDEVDEWMRLLDEPVPDDTFANMSDDEVMEIVIAVIREVRDEEEAERNALLVSEA